MAFGGYDPRSPYNYMGNTASTKMRPRSKPSPFHAYQPTNPGWGQNPAYAAAPSKPPSLAPKPPATPNTVKNPYDFTGDPILQGVIGNNQRVIGEAQAQMTDSEKKALLGFGSSEVAKSLFPNDPTFQQAVANNPYSALANIRNSYEGIGGFVNQMNESENANNLFFSSDRLNNRLPALARARGGEEYNAAQGFQNTIDQLNSQFSATRNQAADAELQARQDALQRSIAAALSSGYGPGAAQTFTSTAPKTYTKPYTQPYSPSSTIGYR